MGKLSLTQPCTMAALYVYTCSIAAAIKPGSVPTQDAVGQAAVAPG